MSDPEDGGPEVIYGTDENNNSVPMRRLSNIYSIGTAANSGCFAVSTAGTTTLDLTSTTACTGRCPACFVKTGTNVVTLSLSNVGTGVWKSAAFSGIRTYLFVNSGATGTFTVTDGSRPYILAGYTMTTAAVQSGADNLMFQSNYGVALAGGVAMCPDGCDSADPKKSSDATTSVALIPTLTTEQTASVGYIVNTDVTANCDLTADATFGGTTSCTR
jgi:hypothetical protein